MLAKMGYYPIPEMSNEYIRLWIENKHGAIENKFHYLDLCCGEGWALRRLTSWKGFNTTWAIELDTERAMMAANSIDHIIQCSIFDARINHLGSIGLLFLNPSYATEEGGRVEIKVLKHSLKWLCSDGILIFIYSARVYYLCFG